MDDDKSFDQIAGTDDDELDSGTANTYGDAIFAGGDPDELEEE